MNIDLTGADWFKSSRSGASSNCVEVAFLPNHIVGVRDSKNPTGPALTFTSAEWSAFTSAATRGEFNS
ncbi:DUF397 domain-containing protein [Nocardia australiensis]|uniref:DUF397 domain-containing protein n=1 Tax=Nocardia australiensis TaxID=2887191 RepID=UPI001D140E91|nr:DUF397 domain-containing protein [Nocardia australiensis]